jgi:hypothetical protein
MDQDKNKIIEIYSGTLWESEIVKSLLKDAEIESFLKNTVFNSYAFEPLKAESVKVMISNYDQEKAKIIVDSFYRNMNENPEK